MIYRINKCSDKNNFKMCLTSFAPTDYLTNSYITLFIKLKKRTKNLVKPYSRLVEGQLLIAFCLALSQIDKNLRPGILDLMYLNANTKIDSTLHLQFLSSLTI